MAEFEHLYERMLRKDVRSMWCPGCGNGIVLQALIRAVDAAGLDQNMVVVVSGIGCSSRGNGYLDVCGLHTNHGRAVAYATGVKLYNPDLHVIVLTGDGDCVSIGGNHFIHGARRNIDMTVIVFNNLNYGMTGGQYSPTTPLGDITKTSVYGNIEPNFDICKLAESAGATYVARSTTYHAQQLSRYIRNGIQHKGFSVVEAMCDCPTLYGRLNHKGNAAQMLMRWKNLTVSSEAARCMPPEEREEKVIIGEFVKRSDRREYAESYDSVIQKARKER